MTVGGVSFHTPKTAEDLLEMLEKGNRNRTQHPTDANQESSRSHAVFQVCFDCHPRVVFFHDWVDLAFEVLSRKLVWLFGSPKAAGVEKKTLSRRLRKRKQGPCAGHK